MGLWHQVQYLEQRVIMLEEHIFQLSMALNAPKTGAAMRFPTYAGRPPYAGQPPRQLPPHTGLAALMNLPSQSEITDDVDPDMASLSETVAGMAETAFSEFGTTYGDAEPDADVDMGDWGDDVAGMGSDAEGSDAGGVGDAGGNDGGDSGDGGGGGDF